jgi:hypothetical protein
MTSLENLILLYVCLLNNICYGLFMNKYLEVKKKIYVFTVTCQKNLGSVGWD